jgi:serine/threonine protein phosphatase PrpC
VTRVCPQCSIESPTEDRFCEECGARLEVPQGIPPDCPKCGASPDEIDPDGYCMACGFRRIASKRDRFEVIVSPSFAGLSDRGLRHHRNEDFLTMDSVGDDAHVIVVCDGVSSTVDADKASEAAAEAAFRSLVQSIESGQDTRRTALLAAISKACAAVTTLASANENPASTIVAAVSRGGFIDIAWLGDSRAYWIGPSDPAQQLTVDDSESPESHAITKWLGADAPEDQVTATVRFAIPGPGHLLLCSDGLWNYLPDPADMVRAGADATETVRTLIEFANASGGHDNITAALLQCGVGARACPIEPL